MRIGRNVLIAFHITAIILFLTLIPFYASAYGVSIGLNIMMWVGLTLSWWILSGFTGYISLGHGAFLGLGAYFAANYFNYLPVPFLIIFAGFFTMIVALIIGLPVLRIRGPYFIILTLGLSELAKYIFILYEVSFRGTVGRVLLGVPSIEYLYFSMLIICLITLAVVYFIKISPFGLALLSIKDDEEAAESAGINTSFAKIIAFAVSALFPGMIGAIIVFRWTYIDPYTVFNPITSFQITLMGFLGGINYFFGPIIGAIILTYFSELLWVRYPNFFMIVLGVILIIVVMFLPQGIAGLVERLIDNSLLKKHLDGIRRKYKWF